MEALPNNLGRRLVKRSAALPVIDVLPDLHSDLQREVLLRVPYKFHEKFRNVCRSWESMINIPDFYDDRNAYGKSEHLICFKQTYFKHLFEEIAVYDPVKCTLERMPPIVVYDPVKCTTTKIDPDQSKLVSVNGKIVLLGGTIGSIRAKTVLIYDFHSRKWGRGADMPTSRMWFACSVSSSKHFIYVAGGCDERGSTLATAEVYNVEADKWEILPPMPQSRKRPLGVFMDGKFMVISGIGDSDWRRPAVEITSAEVFDTKTSTWNTMEDMWPLDMSLQSCLCFLSCGNLYVIDSAKRVIRKYDAQKNVWTPVPFFPKGINAVTCVAPWRDWVFVTGMDYRSHYPASYFFRPSTWESIAIDAGEHFKGYVNKQAATVET